MRGDPEAVADALNLKKSGGEYKGPCPLCGGRDRFHVRPGKQTDLLIFCRHGCQYRDIMKLLETRGIVEAGEFIRPKYRRDDLELADYAILVMESAARRGEIIAEYDDNKFTELALKVDATRRSKIIGLLRQLRGDNARQ